MYLRSLCSALAIAALGSISMNVLADGAPPKVVKKVAPDFPDEASRKGITEGVIKAKLAIDGNGAVTDVAIVEATPMKAKIFSGAASTALNQWKFEASGKPQSFEVKLVFAQE